LDAAISVLYGWDFHSGTASKKNITDFHSVAPGAKGFKAWLAHKYNKNNLHI